MLPHYWKYGLLLPSPAASVAGTVSIISTAAVSKSTPISCQQPRSIKAKAGGFVT
jgi:hypothetical protein